MLVCGEHGFEISDTAEFALVSELTARIHFGAELEADGDLGVDAAARCGIAFLIQRAIAVTETADDIEGLHRKARWIDLRMAGGAGGVGAVFVEQFADGGGTLHVGLHGGNIRRRWFGRFAEKAGHHKRAAHHGRGGGAIGGNFEHGCLGEETTTCAILRQSHAANLRTAHAGDAVMHGQLFIQHGKV